MRTSVPDLRLYPLIIYHGCAGGELDADRRPGIDIELVTCKSGEHYGDRVSAATLFAPPLRHGHCIRTVSTRSERKGISDPLTAN